MEEWNKQILFIGGKGGVGKSTSATAIAWKQAMLGKKTLLVSTDPAHNLGDLFDSPIDRKGTRISPSLTVLEIDPQFETEIYISEVKENMKHVIHSGWLDEVNRLLDTARVSPGADEAAMFNKVIDIVVEERKQYDAIIFDTAPTGHTIRLLSLPELMGVWVESMLQKRKKTNEHYSKLLHDGERVDDPIYQVLKKRQEKFAHARTILLDNDQTGFIFVLNPERLPILETKKAINLLDNYQLFVKSLIINKVLPNDASGEYIEMRRKLERFYLQQIRELFPRKHLCEVPLFSKDISFISDLEIFSSYLEGEAKQ
ncbi:ArsA family ATPase [Virgibacillus sp. MG-45]|uniref:ArsA family ATPase n=1 Tax=Virgibacillus sp. MG-45 TaxID=3102791 RepID=UPI002EDAA954